VLLGGTPLENVFICEEWLDNGHLNKLVATNRDHAKPPEGWGEAWFLIPTLFRHVSALAAAAGGSELLFDEDARREAEWTVIDEAAAVNPKVHEFREVAAFLLSLDRERLPGVWEGPTPDVDQEHVRRALVEMKTVLDKLERRVNHRGDWPR